MDITIGGAFAMNADGESNDSDIHDIDECAMIAMSDEAEFERLLQRFKPFLMSRAARLAGHSIDLREEMTHIASLAFYEAVKSFDRKKGHFFQLMNTVVHKRLIDTLRKSYSRRVETVPMENESDAGYSLHIDKASIIAYREDERRHYLVLEIECLKAELSEWNIAMDDLVAHSPKQKRLRDIYSKMIADILCDDEIMQIIMIKSYFPIKKISLLTKVPLKTVERGRIYIIASLIIRVGDYDLLKGYITDDPANNWNRGRI